MILRRASAGPLRQANITFRRAAGVKVPSEPEALADSTEESASASGTSPQAGGTFVSASGIATQKPCGGSLRGVACGS